MSYQNVSCFYPKASLIIRKSNVLWRNKSTTWPKSEFTLKYKHQNHIYTYTHMFDKRTKREKYRFLFMVFVNISYNTSNKGSGQFVCCHVSKSVCTSEVTSRVSLSKRLLCTHNGRVMNFTNTMKACCFQKIRGLWKYSGTRIIARWLSALASEKPKSYRSSKRANNHCHCEINMFAASRFIVNSLL